MEVWGTHDYCSFINEFLVKQNINNPIIIGHSFGGRVAISLASKIPVKKLVLIDSAGIKPRRGVTYYLKVGSYKLIKKTTSILSAKLYQKLQNRVGSVDYRNASNMMKKILVKIVNEDLTDILPLVNAPTLLIWGDGDLDTPLYQARMMEKNIPDCGLVILKGAGHFSYLDKANDFLRIIDYFLNTNK